jgi:predicted AlkP superfamily pyrophosphatase or phosphodiesterase
MFALMLQSCSQSPRPKLVLLVSIDQMRADYFERYGPEFTGGLGRLYREGLVYANADLNFASSETGPGHATLATGSYPRTHGILANEWIDPQTRKKVYCVVDSGAAQVEGEGGYYSPKNLVVTAFGDWLKVHSLSSKVISVSAKDRAAILMGGKQPDYAFWYDRKTGRMVTSSYYTQVLPQWMKDFNAANWVDKNLPAAWEKLKSEEVYAANGPDEMAGELKWGDDSSFPHAFLEERKKGDILTSPYGDLLVLDFARAAIAGERLGQRKVVDMLAIGLSCTDYVGHAFGPNSHEVHDHLLRLDAALGKFLEELENEFGEGKVLVALSADHGVLPLPEYLTQFKKENARRVRVDQELTPKAEALKQKLQHEFASPEPIIIEKDFLNYAAAAQRGLDSLALENKVRAELLKIDALADVYFRRELLEEKKNDRAYIDLFRRSYYPERGEDFQIRYCENCLITSYPTGTTHGSPYRYDVHVPVIFFGAGIQPGRVDRAIHTVDVAPTLAKFLGYDFPQRVEGAPLAEVLKYKPIIPKEEEE